MQEKMVDIIEDIGKGINIEQLAPKPMKGERNDERTAATKNEKDRD
jgi:phenylalanyl-tRNA synthetase beta subunit